MENRTSGNSYFGSWTEDRWGLPVFECRQSEEIRKKRGPGGGSTTHWHQIGNHRIDALVSIEGILTGSTSEKGLWWLNRYAPRQGELGGGVGFIHDGQESWSILFDRRPLWSEASRRLGIGYTQDTLRYRGLEIDHWIYAPSGESPFLVSEIEIRNRSSENRSLSYFEYWSASTTPIRTLFGDRWSRLQRGLQRRMATFFPDLETLMIRPLRGRAPTLFLAPLPGTVVDSFDSMSDPFWGEKPNLDRPAAVQKGGCRGSLLSPSPLITTSRGCLVLQTKQTLAPQGSCRFRFAFGYAFLEEDLFSTLHRLRTEDEDLLDKTISRWNAQLPSLKLNEDRLLEGEMRWQHYLLQTSLKRSPGTTEILAGGFYRYKRGYRAILDRQAKAIHHWSLLSATDSKDALENLLSYAQEDGSLPTLWGSFGREWGYTDASPYRYLSLLSAVSQYVLFHRDTEFLGQQVTSKVDRKERSVYDLLLKFIERLEERMSGASQGLPQRSSRGWMRNPLRPHDVFHLQPSQSTQGSMMATALALLLLQPLLELFRYAGEEESRSRVAAWTASLKESLRQNWTEQASWLNTQRDSLFLPDLFLPLLIFREKELESVRKTIFNAIMEIASSSALGPPILSRPSWKSDYLAGEGTNGGIWPSVNAFWVAATLDCDKALGWKEFKKMTLGHHSEIYPYLWCGTLSGPEAYNSVQSEHPGESGSFSPFLDWLLPSTRTFPLLDLSNTIGVLTAFSFFVSAQPTAGGLTLSYRLPFAEFRWQTPHFGLERSKNSLSGYWKPRFRNKGAEMTVHLPPDWKKKRRIHLSVNGQKVDFEYSEGGVKFPLSPTEEDLWGWTLR